MSVWEGERRDHAEFTNNLHVRVHVLRERVLGCCRVVVAQVRALTAKVGGLGFDSQWLSKHCFSQFVPIS